MRMLEDGITVARTANDLARYHDKLMIVDGRELYLMAFNSAGWLASSSACRCSSLR